jgi:hypothetical protein
MGVNVKNQTARGEEEEEGRREKRRIFPLFSSAY